MQRIIPLDKYFIGGNQIMKETAQKTYTIKEAARVSGVSEKKIRHWESKNYIPTAQRIICGERTFRQYTESDFALLTRIREYLDEGYTLVVAAKKAAADNHKN
jgi:MerR family redox-sensitive transcriptional activator SoxR